MLCWRRLEDCDDSIRRSVSQVHSPTLGTTTLGSWVAKAGQATCPRYIDRLRSPRSRRIDALVQPVTFTAVGHVLRRSTFGNTVDARRSEYEAGLSAH